METHVPVRLPANSLLKAIDDDHIFNCGKLKSLYDYLHQEFNIRDFLISIKKFLLLCPEEKNQELRLRLEALKKKTAFGMTLL